MKPQYFLFLLACLSVSCGTSKKISLANGGQNFSNLIPVPSPVFDQPSLGGGATPSPAPLLPQPTDATSPPLAPYYIFRSNRPVPPISDGAFLGEVAGTAYLSSAVMPEPNIYPFAFSAPVFLNASGPDSLALTNSPAGTDTCGLKYHGMGTSGISSGGVSCGTTENDYGSSLFTSGDAGNIPRSCSGSCLRPAGPIVPLANGGRRIKMIDVTLSKPGYARIPQGPWDMCKLTYSGATYTNGNLPGGYACSVDFDRRQGAWIIGAKGHPGTGYACKASCFEVPRAAVPKRTVEAVTFFLGADRGATDAQMPEEWDDCSLSYTGFLGLGQGSMGGGVVKENGRWRIYARQTGTVSIDFAASCFRIR